MREKEVERKKQNPKNLLPAVGKMEEIETLFLFSETGKLVFYSWNTSKMIENPPSSSPEEIHLGTSLRMISLEIEMCCKYISDETLQFINIS